MEANAAPFQQVKSEVQSARAGRGGGRGVGGGGDATIFVSTFIVSTCRLQLAFVYP